MARAGGVDIATRAAAELELRRRRRASVGTGKVMGLLEWARAYRRLEGRRFTLERHVALGDLYDDDHPNKVIQKAAQLGLSEYLIILAVWALEYGARAWGSRKTGLNVGYYFPELTALRDFSKERFSALMSEHSHFSLLFTGYKDVGFKKAGDSFLYLRGGQSKGALFSVPLDLLILDEFDRILGTSVTLLNKRLRFSDVRRRVSVSTPTLPGMGINRL